MNKQTIIISAISVAVLLALFSLAKPQETFVALKQQTASSQKNPSAYASFLAVGDIMLSRNVAGKMSAAKDSELPFRGLTDLLRSSDFNFGNLESPFSGKDHFNPTGSLVFNAPTWAIEGLTQYNFNVLTLANNHALDQEFAGLHYTRSYLDEHGLMSLGAGTNLDEAWAPALITARGIRIGFIAASYSSINDNGASTNGYVARIEDVDRLQRAITQARAEADFVVVAMHAGTEYTRKPNQKQIDFAHAAIDAGANLVIGHHPHWIQTIEQYCPSPSGHSDGDSDYLDRQQSETDCKYIFYSLGNFIFDQEWSQDTKEGLVLKIGLSKTDDWTTIDQIELIPIIIENYCCPRLADDVEKTAILKKIDITNPNIELR